MTSAGERHGCGGWTLERAARGAEADVLRLLEAQYAEHELEVQPGLRAMAQLLLGDPERGTLLLARDGRGQAVALAALSFTSSLELGGYVAWLEELYVLPELRGQGLGRALVERAAALARDAGAVALELEVTEDHRRAEHLYQRAGFRPLHRSRWNRPLAPSTPYRPVGLVDHLSLGVNDLARSRAFYDAALAPLGLVAHPQPTGDIGYGPPGPVPTEGFAFYIGFEEPAAARAVMPSAGLHVALRAPSREAVRAFHAAALAAGGRDGGAPGLRQRYHPRYYAAFALDPDGHHIEAVCHLPELDGPLEPR